MNKYLLIFLSAILLWGCGWGNSQKQDDSSSLYIIHAGSLTLPVREMVREFKQEHPGVDVFTEAWGSKAGARRIMDIETRADVFLSADYMVIENMLMPKHATWYYPFATNELSIVYTPKSRHASEINANNWPDILLRPDVKYGRSNPDQDPCGVRSVLALQLAEAYYGRVGLANTLLKKDNEHIRPKETDLIALLEVNQLDYIFLYKSLAIQHGLSILELPDSINLGNFDLNHWYSWAQTQTLGGRPGEYITEFGEAMVYGMTIPHKSTNPDMAMQFIGFVRDPKKGGQILQRLGQTPLFQPKSF